MYGFFKALWERASLEILGCLCLTAVVMSITVALTYSSYHEDEIEIRKWEAITELANQHPEVGKEIYLTEVREELRKKQPEAIQRLAVLEAYGKALAVNPEGAAVLLEMHLLQEVMKNEKQNFPGVYEKYLSVQFARSNPDLWHIRRDYSYKEAVLDELGNGHFMQWSEDRNRRVGE